MENEIQNTEIQKLLNSIEIIVSIKFEAQKACSVVLISIAVIGKSMFRSHKLIENEFQLFRNITV